MQKCVTLLCAPRVDLPQLETLLVLILPPSPNLVLGMQLLHTSLSQTSLQFLHSPIFFTSSPLLATLISQITNLNTLTILQYDCDVRVCLLPL